MKKSHVGWQTLVVILLATLVQMKLLSKPVEY